MGLEKATLREVLDVEGEIEDSLEALDSFIEELEHINDRGGNTSHRHLSLAITHLEEARYRLRDYALELHEARVRHNDV